MAAMDGSAWPRVSLFFIEFSITTRSCTCSICTEFINKLLACRSWPSTIAGLDWWTDTKIIFMLGCMVHHTLNLLLHRTDYFFDDYK